MPQNPGSSKITHEPRSSSFRVSGRDGLSVVTLISVPARTLVPPVTVNSLPLRLRTTGGGGGPAGAPKRPPGAPRPAGAPGPAAPGFAAAPGPAAAPLAAPAPRAP